MKRSLGRLVRVAALIPWLAVLGTTAEAAFPGNDGRIAFSRNGDLYSILPDGTDLAVITRTPHEDHWPRWSPDGQDLVFVRDGDLYLLRRVNGVTAPLLRLTTHGAVVGAPSWHPAGGSVAYARVGQGIWAVALPAGIDAPLLNPSGSVLLWPAWSPRGDRIAYSDGSHLYLSDLVAAPTRLTSEPNRNDKQPVWCADGERIVYQQADTSGNALGIAYVFPFKPVGSGFTGGGISVGNDSGFACRPRSLNALELAPPEVVFSRTSAGFPSLVIGPLAGERYSFLVGGAGGEEADWQAKPVRDFNVLETDPSTRAVFRVTIPASIPRPFTLQWALSPAGAIPDVDYVDDAGSVRVTSSSGEEVNIPLTVLGDNVVEGEEGVSLVVTFPGFTAEGRATILDGDSLSAGPVGASLEGSLVLYARTDGFGSARFGSGADLAFSAEGNRIAYVEDPSGQIAVAEVEPFLDHAAVLTSFGSTASRPAWSPDGSAIAFVVNGSIWLMNADGSNQRPLASGDNPTWSPDGQRIAFNRGAGSLSCDWQGCGSSLHLINVDGTGERTLVGYPGVPGDPSELQVLPAWDPDWSPDGRYLAYTGQQLVSFDAGYSEPHIMLLDLNSPIALGPPFGAGPENPRPLVTPPTSAGSSPCQTPAWSPNGDRVIYSCRNLATPDPRTSPDQLWIASADGSQRALTLLHGISPDWAPLVVRTPRVASVSTPRFVSVNETDADQTLIVPVRITLGDGELPYPVELDWGSENFGASAADYSPQAGTLSFGVGETTSNLVLTIAGDQESEPQEMARFCFGLDPNTSFTCVEDVGGQVEPVLQVTIVDDDGPGVSISDASVSEGDSGTSALTFTVAVLGAPSGSVDVQFATSDGTAHIADGDYLPSSGLVTLSSAFPSATVTVLVRGDQVVEGDETLFVTLSNPTGGAVIVDGQGTGHILTDDTVPVLDPIGNLGPRPELLGIAFSATARDADGDPLTFSLVGAPFGAQIDGSGAFTWLPAEDQGPRSYAFMVRVEDPTAHFAEQPVAVTVTEVNAPPALTLTGVPGAGDPGTPLSFQATAVDPDIPANGLVFSLTGAPAGASVDAVSGTFSWTPTAAEAGSHTFDVLVTDDGSPQLSAAQRVTLVVNTPSGSEFASSTFGPGGGVLTTDTEGDGATAADPIETTVQTPVAGTVTISEPAPGPPPPPTAWSFLGQLAQVTAPAGSPASPLRLTFVLDASIVPAGGVAAIVVFRNGVLVGPCTAAPQALPDPCVSSRQDLPSGDAGITILTSQASEWRFGTPRLTQGLALGVVRPQTGGTVSFSAFPHQGRPAGWLLYSTGGESFLSVNLTAFAVNGGNTAWLAGVGLDGRQFVAYVENNGGTIDLVRLWINGVAKTGDGKLRSGNVFVRP